MFDEEIRAHLHGIKRSKDPSRKLDRCFVDLAFWVRPFTPKLAAEISEAVRDACFRKAKSAEWAPHAIVGGIDLNFEPPMQTMAYRSHEEIEDGGLLRFVKIDKLRACIDQPDQPHLRLEFSCKAEFVSPEMLWYFVARAYQNEILLSFTESEETGVLSFEEMTVLCFSCEETATHIDSDGFPWCEKDLEGISRQATSIRRLIEEKSDMIAVGRRAMKLREQHRQAVAGANPN